MNVKTLLGIAVMATPVLAHAVEPALVPCFTEYKSACHLYPQKIDAQGLAKQFPGKEVGVQIITQMIVPKHLGKGMVISGHLQVFEFVRNGKKFGMSGLYRLSMSWDTDNVDDNPTQETAAKFMGSALVSKLNAELEKGIP